MSKKKILLLVIILLLACTLVTGCGKPQGPGKPENSVLPSASASPRDFGIMAFYEKGWDENTFGHPSLEKHYKDIIALMPFWYTAQDDGSLKENEIEEDIAGLVKQNKDAKLLPLINNGKGVGDKLNDPDFRSALVDSIVKVVNDNNYDGINIDFELLPPESRDGLSALIKELSNKLQNKSVSVSVFPLAGVTEDVNGAYDYQALAQSADFLTIMTYDKHEETSEPGSVAPYDWVSENLNAALEKVGNKEKLVLCISAYGYDWPTGGGDAKYMGLREILALAKEQGAEIKWDDQSRSPYFTYQDNDGNNHEVWFENGDSAAVKGQLAKDKGIRGVAIWRMGFEDDEYWNKISGLK